VVLFLSLYLIFIVYYAETSFSIFAQSLLNIANEKLQEEQEKGNTSALLLPHDTRAIWYADKVLPNAEVLMFRGNFDLDNDMPFMWK